MVLRLEDEILVAENKKNQFKKNIEKTMKYLFDFRIMIDKRSKQNCEMFLTEAEDEY